MESFQKLLSNFLDPGICVLNDSCLVGYRIIIKCIVVIKFRLYCKSYVKEFQILLNVQYLMIVTSDQITANNENGYFQRDFDTGNGGFGMV